MGAKRSEILSDFKNIRNRCKDVSDSGKEPPKREKRHLKESVPKQTERDKFLCKLDDFENTVDFFTAPDLLLFYCHVAENAGVKYVPSKARDCGALKRLTADYSNKEICLMIEFIFNSGQDHVDPFITRPTVLISVWQSTLYRDSLLWAEDKYIPKTKAKHSKREWTKNSDEVSIKIGEWN